MRSRQLGPDKATAVLAGLVPRITYKPGWTFELREIDRGQGCEGLTLCIGATVKDSTTDGQVSILHLMPVLPAAYDEDTWLGWILEQVLLVEQHEAMEFLKVDGDAPYFPEHAPGRNPYTVTRIKTREQAHAAAKPWSGGPATYADFG